MKKSIFILLYLVIQSVFAQNTPLENHTLKAGKPNKGRLYFYWGWNRSAFSKSDITFKGQDYRFTLRNVKAKDRQTPLSASRYLNPANITIPQYNFRIGYFIKEHWDISFGIDHMKYVVDSGQTVGINGVINEGNSPFNGVYQNDDIKIVDEFLKLEHTDGLNYINIAIRRSDKILNLHPIAINITEGIGAGGLYPKSDVTLLGKERNNEFHFSGYGVDATVGINISFWDRFFIQTEAKGGYINLTDIITSSSNNDRAKQSFFFGQTNIVFGAIFHLKRK